MFYLTNYGDEFIISMGMGPWSFILNNHLRL